MKTKCEVYWPREVGCSTVHGSVEVTLTDFTQLADYTIRSLTLNKVWLAAHSASGTTHLSPSPPQAGSGKEGREVSQFHFTLVLSLLFFRSRKSIRLSWRAEERSRQI